MKTLKNLFAALFAVALLTSFVACSNGDDEDTRSYSCGELANTEWVQVVGDVETDFTVKFTDKKFICSEMKNPDTGKPFEYDVVINEEEHTFHLYYGGSDMEQEFKYESIDDTHAKIYTKNALGEFDELGIFKLKS